VENFVKVIKDHIEYLENLFVKNELKIEQLDKEIRENKEDSWRTKEMIIYRLRNDNLAIIMEIEKYRERLQNA
jgi:hypothetical protein